MFIEVIVDDSSEFETHLHVRGMTRHGFRILQVHSSHVPGTIGAVMLLLRVITGLMPHVCFRWTEGNPLVDLVRFLVLGEGGIAPVSREVLCEAEPDLSRRPWVHVG
jgi:hypothetical protein